MKMMCDSGTSGTNTAGRQAVASPDHDPIDLLREYGNQYDRDSQTFVWLFDVACAAAETNGRDVRSVMGLLELAMLHDRVLASISGRGGAQRDPVIWKWRETLSSDLQHDWDLLVEECSRAYRDANQEAPESPTKHDLTVHWFSRPKWWPR